MQHKSLRPSQVRLDPQNPRLPDGTTGDSEAINALLAEGYDELRALAKDIATTGQMNPTELPIVMKEGSKYTVLEGNRRFAALKLLHDPGIAEADKHRTAFERLKSKATVPSSVLTVVVGDRDEADHWLTLRHTGANGGVGVRSWSAVQANTYAQRKGGKVDGGTARALVIADELLEAYATDAALVALIRKVRSSKVTNIGRLFSKDLMDRVGLSVKKTDDMKTRPEVLWSDYSAATMHKFFRWAFKTLDEESVDAFKNAEIRRQLLDRHTDVEPAATDKLKTSRRLADTMDEDSNGEDPDPDEYDNPDPKPEGGRAGDGSGDDPGPDDSDPEDRVGQGGPVPEHGPGGTGKREAKPEKYLFQDLKVPHLCRDTQFLLKEARQVEHDALPRTSIVMCRVVLEVAVSEPDVLKWSKAKEDETLYKKLKAALVALDPTLLSKPVPDRPELVMAWSELNNFGVRFLHQFVHSHSAAASPANARGVSRVWRPVLEAVNERTGTERAKAKP